MIEVRAAVRSDVPFVLSLVRELAEYERAAEEVVATESAFEEALFGAAPSAYALVGLLDGAPAGFALWFRNFSTWLGRPGIYLEDLFVRPSARGHGLGRALLAELARVAVAGSYGRVDWAVLHWNSPAIGFYRSLGAEPLEDWATYRLTGQALRRLARAR